MPYDLYGNSYPTEREAMNAEYAQMAQIEAGIASRDARHALEQHQTFANWQSEIERRVVALEEAVQRVCEAVEQLK